MLIMRLINKTLFAILASISISKSSFAATDPYITKNCKATPTVLTEEDVNLDEVYYHGNDLRRKAGGSFLAKGDLITIQGRVMDARCMPVQNALVTIWHTNSMGEYQYNYTTGNDFIDAPSNIDPNFTGIGQAYSDNLGYYSFLTIKPAEYQDRVPHINVKITHTDFPTMQTQIFFSDNDSVNHTDKILNTISADFQHLLIANLVKHTRDASSEYKEKHYRFDITFSNNTPYKRY